MKDTAGSMLLPADYYLYGAPVVGDLRVCIAFAGTKEVTLEFGGKEKNRLYVAGL